MKICVIGTGSIGSRHIQNIATILTKQDVLFTLDVLRSSRKKLSTESSALISNQYFSVETLPNNYDVIIVANPTIYHFETIKSISNKTEAMFIEKPVFEKWQYNISELNLDTNGVYYVACPLRHTLVYKNLKRIVMEEKIISAMATCSSYLPNWRKNIDYRKSYSADKNLGGGVAIDLIHEWDYLCDLFGFPLQYISVNGKYSTLEINSDDLSVSIGKYPDKIVEVHLDYFGRETTRQVKMFTELDVITADYTTKEIRTAITGKVIDCNENNNEYYMREMEYFFELISSKKKNINDISHALKVLRLVQGG